MRDSSAHCVCIWGVLTLLERRDSDKSIPKNDYKQLLRNLFLLHKLQEVCQRLQIYQELQNCLFMCVHLVCLQLLEVRMQSELNETDSPDGGGEPTSAHHTPGASPHTSGPPSQPSTSSNNSDGGNMPCLKYERHAATQKHFSWTRKSTSVCAHPHTHKSHAFCLEHTCTNKVGAWSVRRQKPPHHPSAATHARPSTNMWFTAAPLIILSRSHSLLLFVAFCLLVRRVRSTPLKQSAGYQVDLVVQLVWVSGEPPQQITSLALNSSYGL